MNHFGQGQSIAKPRTVAEMLRLREDCMCSSLDGNPRCEQIANAERRICALEEANGAMERVLERIGRCAGVSPGG